MSFIQFVTLLILSIHVQHICMVNSQGEGQVDDEESKDPTPLPTLQPTNEFPKYLTFTMSLFMSNTLFNNNDGKGNNNGNNENINEYNLNKLFTRTLCLCVFRFEEDQCNRPITKESPNPTTSPTTEPTYDPTYDPTQYPTYNPTIYPTIPTVEPTYDPTIDPTTDPTIKPTKQTINPTANPTNMPTNYPSIDPTLNPTVNPTFSPTQNTNNPTYDPTYYPSVNPTFYPTTPTNEPTIIPTLNPSSNPSITPSFSPTLEPTLIPTNEPTLEPTYNPTDVPSYEPTLEPTYNPTSDPIKNRRRLLSNTSNIDNVYDLQLQFYVIVKNRQEQHIFYKRIKSYYFFNEYKHCLLDSLESKFVLENYKNTSIVEYKTQIESMEISPLNDINILSPTYSPTSYPTYNYKRGKDYGLWMIALGICLTISILGYWLYTRYTIHQDYKAEQKSAPPDNIELQEALFHD